MSGEILVTGGTGYIGSHTVIELLKADYDVVIIDNFSNSSMKVIDRIEKITDKRPILINTDLLNKENIYDVFEKFSFSSVIHFAGLKAVGESVNNPLKYYYTNIASTVNLCEVMTAFDVKNFIFSSSATVYSAQNKMPINEDGNLGPNNPYGRTKLFIEEMLSDLYQSDSNWKITLLRYFNPVGAHESGLIGESPNGTPNNLMPFITSVAVGKQKNLKVFGSDYNTKDGTGVRDYIHVIDLAKGHVQALKHNCEPGIKTYNLGTGKGYSVLEVVKTFQLVNGVNVPYEIVDRRPGDIPISYADVTKAKDQLNWNAEKGIIEMCKDAWNWQKNNPNGYN
ncbi:UDP-glucose 4-epimerase GalE [Virgibacillus sp. W0181]|uniref:UDP-glucose 4-epimerase GalE n=1 Tax=Virgibacillus sp. W0181 TaxID=3391581 RepID=UPI003F45BBD6